MKTLVDIDSDLLNKVMKSSHKKTKRETIQTALKEYLRALRREQLRKRIGSGSFDLTLEKLEQLRQDDKPDFD